MGKIKIGDCEIGKYRYLTEDEIKLEKNIKHNIEAVVDRIIVKDGIEGFSEPILIVNTPFY